MEEACEISNRIAPEHLEVSSREPQRWEPLLRHAGAIFLGAFTSESLGDYCAGPNHVLPTVGHRALLVAAGRLRLPEAHQPDRGQRGRRAGARRRSPPSWRTAKGLQAHARAAEMRLERRRDGERPMTRRDRRRPRDRRSVIRQDVQSMHAYAIQPSAGLVKLDAMENPFRLPRGAAARARRAARPRSRSTAIRPAAWPTCVAALARHVELPAGCKLMLGNGSDELISLLAMACDVPGATVLAPLPGFVMYEMSAQLQGLQLRRRAADAPTSSSTRRRCWRRSRRTARRSPTSPTRTTRPPTCSTTRAIERIVAAVGAQDGLVVFDEAYQPFSSRTLDGSASARHAARAGDAHAEQVRPGRRAPRLPGRRRRR